MPEIARFFGLTIRMYYNDHDPPHFHASYAGREGRLRIAPIGVMDGDLPARPLALAVEWATLHQAELLENWRRLQADEPPARIAPLE